MTLPRLQVPFVIWTLQRTGGTNFNTCLNRMSDRPRLQDELFNPGRVYGHLQEAWKRTKNEAALQQAIGEVCASQANFKHCVELVPRILNDILVESTVAHGYNHIFLYRHNLLERILSREYARRTAIWGPKQARAAEGRDMSAAMVTPLSANDAIRHETKANTYLNRAWTALKDSGVTPTSIAFEELYATDRATTQISLERVFSGLGLRLTLDQITEIRKMIQTGGNQKTREKYSQFKGIDQIEQRLGEIPNLLCST